MYLWVIIATLIAALFAMNTSIRPDIEQLYIEPQAQTVVTKLYVQHRAAMSYISKHSRSSGLDDLNYWPGELTADMLKNDLPYGFQQDSGLAKFTTWIYCLNRNNLEQTGAGALPSLCTSGLPTGEGGSAGEGDSGEGSGGETEDENTDLGNGSNCCNDPSAVVYVLTYGCVPSKWQDIRTGKPGARLLGSMKTTTGYTNGLGYAIDRDELSDDIYTADSAYTEEIDTNMGVYGQGGQFYTPIPNYISETSMGNRSFANVCGSLRQSNEEYDPQNPQDNMYSSCDYCLVYMSRF